MKDEELNVILEQMAEEVPPMPADFHDRWMNAVRAEAQKTAPAAEDTTQRKTVSLVRWTRILSVAAAFVFLIGGTLLWRSTKQSLSVSGPAEKQAAEAVIAAEEEAAVPAAEEPLVMTAGRVNGEGEPAAVYSAVQAPAAEEVAEAEAAEPDLSVLMKAAGTSMNSFAASSEMAAGAVMAEEEADYAMESACEAATIEDAEEPALTAAPTAAPTAEPTAALTATPEPAPEPTEAPEPENTGFLQAAGAFFSDMGDFLLAALPYLLVLAVPAAAALVIRRKKAGK